GDGEVEAVAGDVLVNAVELARRLAIHLDDDPVLDPNARLGVVRRVERDQAQLGILGGEAVKVHPLRVHQAEPARACGRAGNRARAIRRIQRSHGPVRSRAASNGSVLGWEKRRRPLLRVSTNSASNSMTTATSTRTLAIALMAGLTPRRMDEKSRMGSVCD